LEEENSFIVISVDYVSGQSLNPKGVKWRDDMQVVETNIGTFIDTLPFKKYGNEIPGYDWRQHIGGLPVNNFEISKSVTDYPWVKKKNISENQNNRLLPNSYYSPAARKKMTQEEALEFIRSGESNILELKKSAVWGPGDTHKARLKMGKFQILKAIAGFSNSKSGGVLIIGVDDNQSVVGLEEDFNNKKSRDKWEQYIIDIIKNKFKKDFQPQWLNQYFIDISDKERKRSDEWKRKYEELQSKAIEPDTIENGRVVDEWNSGKYKLVDVYWGNQGVKSQDAVILLLCGEDGIDFEVANNWEEGLQERFELAKLLVGHNIRYTTWRKDLYSKNWFKNIKVQPEERKKTDEERKKTDEEKSIFVIDVLPNKKPIFLDDLFYVRVGNVTQLLTGESVHDYIRERFPN
jgi:hypothetical protein